MIFTCGLQNPKELMLPLTSKLCCGVYLQLCTSQCCCYHKYDSESSLNKKLKLFKLQLCLTENFTEFV